MTKTLLCMQKFFWLCLTLVPLIVSAQVSDDFSDGDFTNDPVWTGTDLDFLVNASKQLQLNDNAAATALLSTQFAVLSLDSIEWHAFVKMGFDPSSSNFGRFYLTSNSADLSGSLNGYYLQFGEAGSNDAVRLFRQSGSISTLVCSATTAAIATSFTIRVKVTRKLGGNWSLFIDYNGGENYVLESTGVDNSYTTSDFMGIRCSYTASNATKFFFDDFYIGDIIVDTTPPQLSSVTATSATTLSVVFNEKVQPSSATNTTNFQVNNGIGMAMTASLQADEKTILLTFANNFANAQTSILSVSNVADQLGNAIATATKDFFYFQPVPAAEKDVIIQEIFPDPSPMVGLPGFEFIELYNRSSKAFDLSGWIITDGSSVGMLTTFILQPNAYLLISSTAAVAELSMFGNTLGIANFPSLNNDGDALVLKDKGGVIVDSINYQADWYRDEDKQQGGWTLELIDPQNICGEEDNWIASENEAGGTPGTQNSVNENKPDLTGPQFASLVLINAETLKLTFNEKLSAQLPPVSSFVLTPFIEVFSVSFTGSSLCELLLHFLEPLQENLLYELEITALYDCAGNVIQEDTKKRTFALPQQAGVGDVVINEILFNPQPSAVDFVEVYNNSSKFINLKNWSLANEEGVNQEQITSSDFLVHPHSYFVFTSDKETVMNEYPQSKEEIFFEADLPSMNDDDGSISIMDSSGNVLDVVKYSEKWHSALLKDEEGVSLERISFTEDSNKSTTWRSGVAATGFATPGYANANMLGTAGFMDEAVRMEPEIFEPTYGQPNVARIHYKFDQPGLIANAKIYDVQGREIKNITNNEVLASEGFFTWDGDTNDGTKARIGYYTLWFEVFDTSGIVKTFRKRIVVAGKF